MYIVSGLMTGSRICYRGLDGPILKGNMDGDWILISVIKDVDLILIRILNKWLKSKNERNWYFNQL